MPGSLNRRVLRCEVGLVKKVDKRQILDENLRIILSKKRDTIRRIREAMENKRLGHEFRAEDVNKALGIEFAGTFLPKHRVGNRGRNTELFVRISAGLYRLK